MATHITDMVMEAELLWRRGDNAMYTHVVPLNSSNQGAGGSIKKAIYFIINNPTGHSLNWNIPTQCTLEPVYRFFAETVNGRTLDTFIGQQLGIGGTRVICDGVSSKMSADFLTLTHGFAVGEIPTPPPVTPAP